MARLRDDHSRFRASGADIIAVGPNGRADFERYWRAHRIPFIGIPDPDHRLARLYGQEVNLLKLGRMPMLIVIDGAGMIRYLHRGESMSDIPDNAALLEVIQALQAEGQGP